MIHSQLEFLSYMSFVTYNMSAFLFVCAVCSAVHNQLCIKWPFFSCGWSEMAGDCVVVYLTDVKINTQELEMLAEKNEQDLQIVFSFYEYDRVNK